MRQTYAPRGKMKADPIGTDDLIRAADTKPRCRATSKGSGKPCGYPPIPGGYVCRFHGGGAPQVKLKALERLKAYQDKAIDRLFELAEQTQFPSTALAAVKDVLDRTEGRAKETVDMQVSGELLVIPGRLQEARRRLAARQDADDPQNP